MQSGVTPPSESSGAERSRSSPEDPKLPSGTRIPAASTILVPRRASGSNLSRNNPQPESSDTSMEDRGRARQRARSGPDPSSSSSRHNPNVPIDLNATQASFLAGAAVTQAHQASLIANNAADVALSSQLEVQHAQQVAKAIHAGAVQQQSDFAQAAAAYQQQATRAYLAQQEEARAAIEQRDRNFQLLEMRAQQQVQGIHNEAEREILANRGVVQERAQQWVNDNIRPLQEQIAIGSQQLVDRDNQLVDREIRIARLQSQLDAIQQQGAHNIPVATPTPIPESPMTVHTEFDLFEGHNPFTSDVMDGSATPIHTPPRQPTGMSPRESPLIQFNPVLPDAAQPASSTQNMSSVPSIPISFGPPVLVEAPEGLPLSSSAIVPLQSGLVQPSPVPAPSAVQLNVGTAASEHCTNEDRISALQDQVSQLMQALHTQTQLVAQLQAAKAPMPIAPPPSTPQALAMGGAALSAPIGQTAACSVVAPLPQQVLPPGLPPLPLSKAGLLPRGSPYVYNSGSQRSKQSGSSESSSDSDAGRPPPNPYAQCRICGEFHDEVNCPYLTMNMGGGDFPDQGSDQPRPGDAEVRDYADEEDNTIRVKSLNDLVFPNPPENAGQARGYANQVLMAIGKLQKTPV